MSYYKGLALFSTHSSYKVTFKRISLTDKLLKREQSCGFFCFVCVFEDQFYNGHKIKNLSCFSTSKESNYFYFFSSVNDKYITLLKRCFCNIFYARATRKKIWK